MEEYFLFKRKKGNSDTYYNMNFEDNVLYKSLTKRTNTYNCIYMKVLKSSLIQRQKVDCGC